MIGKTSSKNSRNKNIQIQKQKLKQESYLSGAYIRSLVKQLSSQRSKATMSPKLQGEKVGNESAKFGKVIPETQQQQMSSQRPQSQLQPKKQVRRRLHSRKPYQQRLLNMAEARREIVAALKFHRASMKQVSERQQQQEQHKQLSSLLEFPPYSLSTNRENSFLDMNPWRNLANQIAPVSSPYGYMSTTTSAPTSHLSNPSWSLSSISPFETSGNLGIIPPVLPLGLNLNLQSFKDIETAVTFTEADASPLMDLSCVTTTASSAPSPSTSSAYSFSSGALSASEVPSVWLGTVGASEVTSEPTIDSLYHFVAEPEVEGLQNIGNQHNMDWNDTLNSVQSDWWHELLETVENGSVVREERVVDGNGDGIHLETIDYPSWPSDQQLMHNFYQGVEHPGDLAFPCLDIGEVEGLGGEWIL